MGLEGDATAIEKRDTKDLDQRQDEIIREIRKKEKPGFLKRIVALLQYFSNRDYLP
jgi:hypothetical protein